MSPRNSLLLAFLLLLALNVASQEKDDQQKKEPLKENQINFSIGPSFAMGDFSESSTTNENSGFAGNGVNLYLYYNHRFAKNFGVSAKWFGNSNKYDSGPMIKELNSETGVSWTSSDSYWATGGILIGLALYIPLDENVMFDFRILGGLVWSTSPEVKYSVTSHPEEWVKLEDAYSMKDGFNFGFGLTYFFNPKWGLNINLDYLNAAFQYDEVFILNSDGERTHVHDVKQPFEVFNVTAGISFYF